MKYNKSFLSAAYKALLLVLAVFGFAGASWAQSVKLSASALTFSPQLIGTTSTAQSVTVNNTDTTTPLAIGNILLSGDYLEVDDCGTNLPPSSACTIFVTFSPAVGGMVSGAMTMQNNASNSPQVVSLSGSGLTPVSLSPTSLSFGTVAVGSKSASKPLTITNNQSASLTFNFSSSGDYSAIGSGATPCTTTLAAHSSCTVAVTFQPTVSGAINGALTVTHNAEFSPQSAGLAGTGSGGSAPPLSFSPSSLSFGNVVVSATSPGQVVTVTNGSNSAVSISGISGSGNYTAASSGATPCGGSLNSKQSCTFTVTFSPTLPGTVSGAVTISDNTAGSPQVLNLTGKGILPVSLSPASLTFAAQQLGTTSAPQIVTLSNQQTVDTVTIDSIAVSGDFFNVSAGRHPCSDRVSALSSCTIGVVFSPGSGRGGVSGALAVSYNASPSPAIAKLTAAAAGLLPRFAYVANSDNTVSSYTVNSATGQLRSTGYALAGTRPNSVAVTPSGAFVYTANFASGNVSGYAAASGSGALTAVSGSPFAGQADAFAITVDPSSRFVYVANANSSSNNISGYTINSATGALTQMSGSSFQAGTDTRALAVDPTGKFLYAANATSGNVSAYTIDATTGVLTQINGSPFSLPGVVPVPQSITVDPASKFVFVPDSAGSGVWVFTMNSSTGALTLVAGSPFPDGSSYGVVVDPSDRFLYTANSGAGIAAFSINSSTGALTAISGSPFPAGNTLSLAADPAERLIYAPDATTGNILAFAIDSSSGALTLNRTIHGRSSLAIAVATGTVPVTYTPKFAYVANDDDNNVGGYAIDAGTGNLTAVSGSPFKGGTNDARLATDPAGKFLYTANFGANSASAYSINAISGALTQISGSPFAAGTEPFSVTVDPSGRFVYVANSFSDNVSGFSINPASGKLTALSGSPFSTGTGTSPFYVAVDPSGSFLFVVKNAKNQVESFSIDPASGNLTAISSVPTGMSPESVAVDPSGRFAYVSAQDNTVSAYAISSSGALGAISGSPFPTGGAPNSVTVDPSGRFLYTANNSSDDVSAFTIDQNTGALTPIGGSPFPAGMFPWGVAVDLSGNFVYVANSGENDVSAYTINQASGALAPVPAGPFPAGANVFSVATTVNIH